jgi:Family of unknown function (DUF6011)
MASIRCGQCKGTHESVEQVKRCYAGKGKATASNVRSNRYAGTCALCFGPVGENEGRLVPNDGDRNGYKILHLDGQCRPAQPKQDAPRTVAPADFSAVHGGYYATVNTRGTNDFDFWYVKEGRKPGFRFVKRYIGGQGPQRISRTESLRALHAILAEGVDKCGDRFADEMQRCRDCGLPLTDEISRRERRGPVCRSK